MNLTEAQKLARHHDPKLTANIYTHLNVCDLGGDWFLAEPTRLGISLGVSSEGCDRNGRPVAECGAGAESGAVWEQKPAKRCDKEPTGGGGLRTERFAASPFYYRTLQQSARLCGSTPRPIRTGNLRFRRQRPEPCQKAQKPWNFPCFLNSSEYCR